MLDYFTGNKSNRNWTGKFYCPTGKKQRWTKR